MTMKLIMVKTLTMKITMVKSIGEPATQVMNYGRRPMLCRELHPCFHDDETYFDYTKGCNKCYSIKTITFFDSNKSTG